jgi:hypothetical protein
MKAQFKTREGARKGAEDLKRRFPMLQIKVDDAEARLTEEWQITPGHDATPRQTAPQLSAYRAKVPVLEMGDNIGYLGFQVHSSADCCI